MAYTVMAYTVVAYTVMVYIVMRLYSYGLYSYGLYSYGLYSYVKLSVSADDRIIADPRALIRGFEDEFAKMAAAALG